MAYRIIVGRSSEIPQPYTFKSLLAWKLALSFSVEGEAVIYHIHRERIGEERGHVR